MIVGTVAIVCIVYLLRSPERAQGVVSVLGALGQFLGRGGGAAKPQIVMVPTNVAPTGAAPVPPADPRAPTPTTRVHTADARTTVSRRDLDGVAKK